VTLIDTHAHVHLDRFDTDRPAVLQRARAAGVTRLINIGYDLPSSQASVALAESYSDLESYPQIWATVGIQPHYALTTTSDDLATIQALLAHPRVVALGEIGLDYHHNRAPQADQETLFRRQIAIARAAALPIVIHARDAQADIVRVLADAARGLPIVMHAFSGDWDYAAACLELGAYLSFAGPVTFRNAAELHEVARRAPLERMLIETDCPYLAPHPHRGQRNEPAYVRLVAERIAELRGVPVEEIVATTWANAHTVFSRMRDPE
jgi:TatD DNase family protein